LLNKDLNIQLIILVQILKFISFKFKIKYII